MTATTKLSEFLCEWLATAVKPNCAYATYVAYEGNIRNHINPILGEMPLCDLTVFDLQKFATRLCSADKKLSVASVRLTMSVLNNALDFAESCGLLVNPCKRVRKPRVRRTEVEVFTRAEQKTIEDGILASNDSRLLGILISLYAGLRLGEVCALQWLDFDEANFRLSVKATMKRTDERDDAAVAPSRTKTPQSDRIVPIPRFLVERLVRERESAQSDYILSRKGRFVNPRTLQELFRRHLENVGVAYKNFHVCRHTYATRAIELGIDVKTLSVCLGHSNASITINRYVHSLDEHKQRVSSIFDAFHATQQTVFA